MMITTGGYGWLLSRIFGRAPGGCRWPQSDGSRRISTGGVRTGRCWLTGCYLLLSWSIDTSKFLLNFSLISSYNRLHHKKVRVGYYDDNSGSDFHNGEN